MLTSVDLASMEEVKTKLKKYLDDHSISYEITLAFEDTDNPFLVVEIEEIKVQIFIRGNPAIVDDEGFEQPFTEVNFWRCLYLEQLKNG